MFTEDEKIFATLVKQGYKGLIIGHLWNRRRLEDSLYKMTRDHRSFYSSVAPKNLNTKITDKYEVFVHVTTPNLDNYLLSRDEKLVTSSCDAKNKFVITDNIKDAIRSVFVVREPYPVKVELLISVAKTIAAMDYHNDTVLPRHINTAAEFIYPPPTIPEARFSVPSPDRIFSIN